MTSPNARPGLTLGPIHSGPWDQEAIIFGFSNMSVGTLAAAKGPQAREVLEALRITLNLPDDTGLGWHTYSRHVRQGELVMLFRDGVRPATLC